MKIDAENIFIFGGLALIGAGLWLYEPWIALTTVGSLLFILGIYFGIYTARK